MSRNSRLDAALQDIYSEVPDVPCDGRCAALVCRAPVDMSDREHQRTPITADPCQHLSSEGRCWVYDQRPMECRLWGATEEMPCPFGCKPRHPLTAEQEFALFVYSLAIGGGSRVGWPQMFDPEQVMDAYRADAAGVRTRFLAGRAAAREATSLAAEGQTAPDPHRAT